MSHEGSLPELERLLDDALRRYHGFDNDCMLPAAYWHGVARGVTRSIALIAHTSETHEWDEAARRVRVGGPR